MDHDTFALPPSAPLPLRRLCDVQHRVLTARQLREHGVGPAAAAGRCRPEGPWQQLLPGVFLLHPGPPTGEERLHAALLYTAYRNPSAVPVQSTAAAQGPYGAAMITGLAALTLHRFCSAPPLPSLDRIDVLVPGTRRLREAGFVHVVRARELPRRQLVTGVPVAPPARAAADAVAQLDDAAAVRRLLTECVRGGHCEAAAVVRELTRAQLLGRPEVADAAQLLPAEGRAVAEGRLYEVMRAYGLPEPLWNVELRQPAGPELGAVDAYWPNEAVAVEIDAGFPRDDDPLWSDGARKQERLERLGITVVQMAPHELLRAPARQATAVRSALLASADRDPAAYVIVLPK